jgi:hypothetical protein
VTALTAIARAEAIASYQAAERRLRRRASRLVIGSAHHRELCSLLDHVGKAMLKERLDPPPKTTVRFYVDGHQL